MPFRGYNTECPRCGHKDEIVVAPIIGPPAISCGDCFYHRAEVVELRLTEKPESRYK